MNDSVAVELKYIRRDLDTLVKDVTHINEKIESGFVSRELFEVRVGRLERLVYGMVAVILTSFLLALAGLVLIV